MLHIIFKEEFLGKLYNRKDFPNHTNQWVMINEILS